MTIMAYTRKAWILIFTTGLPLPSNNSIVQNILEGYIPTAIATLIEPVWILINRLLCLLQPLEELRQCDARASNSIDLGYSSLPPQLVVFKALRAKHFILALVCVMSLLANLLAVALAGMFEHRTFDMARSAMFSAPMTFRFVPINGTIGYQTTPQDYGLLNSDLFLETSIMDAYLIADANVTRGTSLPMWVDDQFFYRPFFSNTSLGPAGSSEANTQVLGAELDCSPLKVGEYFRGELTPDLNTFKPTFNLTIDEGSSTFQCKLPSMTWFLPGPDNTRVQGPSAAEMILQMEPVNENSSRAEVEACVGTTILGWLRTTNHGGNLTIQTPTNENATFIQCKPKFLVGTATIRVDAAGRLLSKPKNLEIEAVRQNDTAGLFSNDPKYLIAQTHKQLFTDLNAEWHNDTITNQGTNYFIKHLANNTRLIDPTLPMPTFDDIMPSLNKAYSALFALWLATNKDILFIKQLDDSKVEAIAGWKTEPETRVFVVKPMFVIAEVIFIVYMFAIPLVYMRRPGRYLPRLPTSIAAVIALFAASTAVGDMKNTSHMDAKRRAQYLKNLDRRYGYGSYIGPDDGRVHIGIERIPFVRRRTKTTWLDKRLGK